MKVMKNFTYSLSKIRDSRTNWKYLLIVMILALLVSGGIWGYLRCFEREISSLSKYPEIKKLEKSKREKLKAEEEIANWKTYRNEEYGFEFKYPSDAKLTEEVYKDVYNVHIELPFTPGTTLVEKNLNVGVIAEKCSETPGPGIEVEKPKVVRVGEIEFVKEVSGEAAAGSVYDDICYSTTKNGYCVYLCLFLHSVNPGNLPVPRPDFDYEKETKILDEIISTFKFIK
jgi:hypothetical protein